MPAYGGTAWGITTYCSIDKKQKKHVKPQKGARGGSQVSEMRDTSPLGVERGCDGLAYLGPELLSLEHESVEMAEPEQDALSPEHLET